MNCISFNNILAFSAALGPPPLTYLSAQHIWLEQQCLISTAACWYVETKVRGGGGGRGGVPDEKAEEILGSAQEASGVVTLLLL